MEAVLAQHPALVAAVLGVLTGLGGLWVVMARIRTELRGVIVEVVEPLLDHAITTHNRDEDAHEAANNKVRKERMEMIDGIRERMDEQHKALLVAVTRVETNQDAMARTLGEVAHNLAKLKHEHDVIVSNESLRRRRYSDINGTDFGAVRHNPDCPKRATDPDGDDHRPERGK